VFKQHHVVSTMCPLLGSADAPFDIWDVFVFPADIELGFEIGGNGATSAFEFGVANVNPARTTQQSRMPLTRGRLLHTSQDTCHPAHNPITYQSLLSRHNLVRT
jgi:hypothetical protein